MNKFNTILVTGSTGQLGRSIQSIISDYPEFEFVFASRQHLDLSDEGSIAKFFERKTFDSARSLNKMTCLRRAEQKDSITPQQHLHETRNSTEK